MKGTSMRSLVLLVCSLAVALIASPPRQLQVWAFPVFDANNCQTALAATLVGDTFNYTFTDNNGWATCVSAQGGNSTTGTVAWNIHIDALNPTSINAFKVAIGVVSLPLSVDLYGSTFVSNTAVAYWTLGDGYYSNSTDDLGAASKAAAGNIVNVGYNPATGIIKFGIDYVWNAKQIPYTVDTSKTYYLTVSLTSSETTVTAIAPTYSPTTSPTLPTSSPTFAPTSSPTLSTSSPTSFPTSSPTVPPQNAPSEASRINVVVPSVLFAFVVVAMGLW